MIQFVGPVPQFDVTLKRELDPAAGQAEVFPQEITRVLLNLISNGFHAVAKRKSDDGAADYEPVVIAATRDRGDSIEIRPGDRIAQLIFTRISRPDFVIVPAFSGEGGRQESGFGSTGVEAACPDPLPG